MNRNGIVHLDCWNIKTCFAFLGLLSALIFILGAFDLWCFCPLGFSLSHMIILTEWGMCTPVSRDHMNRNGIVHLDLWSIKIFSGFVGLLSAMIFILGAFCPMVFLSIGFFSVPPHDHINRMGNVHTCIT